MIIRDSFKEFRAVTPDCSIEIVVTLIASLCNIQSLEFTSVHSQGSLLYRLRCSLWSLIEGVRILSSNYRRETSLTLYFNIFLLSASSEFTYSFHVLQCEILLDLLHLLILCDSFLNQFHCLFLHCKYTRIHQHAYMLLRLRSHLIPHKLWSALQSSWLLISLNK